MHKEKSEKPTRKDVPFPEGSMDIYFGPSETDNNIWTLGRITLLLRVQGDPAQGYVGAIAFAGDVNVIKNDPYPLEVNFPGDDTINFHVQGATRKFNENLPPQFHFKFDGKCAVIPGGIELSGSGGVPADFCPPGKAKSGPPTADGQTVGWTSRGHGDPHHKPSK
jgi:hypothetical protein